MKYVMFGRGSNENVYRDYVVNKQKNNILYFVDNDIGKRGNWSGFEVYSPEVLKEEKREYEKKNIDLKSALKIVRNLARQIFNIKYKCLCLTSENI